MLRLFKPRPRRLVAMVPALRYNAVRSFAIALGAAAGSLAVGGRPSASPALWTVLFTVVIVALNALFGLRAFVPRRGRAVPRATEGREAVTGPGRAGGRGAVVTVLVTFALVAALLELDLDDGSVVKALIGFATGQALAASWYLRAALAWQRTHGATLVRAFDSHSDDDGRLFTFETVVADRDAGPVAS